MDGTLAVWEGEWAMSQDHYERGDTNVFRVECPPKKARLPETNRMLKAEAEAGTKVAWVNDTFTEATTMSEKLAAFLGYGTAFFDSMFEYRQVAVGGGEVKSKAMNEQDVKMTFAKFGDKPGGRTPRAGAPVGPLVDEGEHRVTVKGSGRNVWGSFDLVGALDLRTMELVCEKKYRPAKQAKAGGRRASAGGR